MRSARLSLCLLLAGLLGATACGDDGTTDAGTDSAGPDASDMAGDADAEGDGDVEVDADVSADLALDGGGSLEACQTGASTTLTAADGAEIRFALGQGQQVAVEVPGGAVAQDEPLALRCLVDDIAPTADGTTIMGPAVEVDFDGELLRYATVELPTDSSLLPDGARLSALRLYFRPANADRVVSPPGIDMQENRSIGFVRFKTRQAGVFQIGIDADAGQVYDREWTFRAITGVSMGCSGAVMIGLRNPEVFDIIGGLGGPTDWTYLMHYIREGGFGGFEPAPTYGSAPYFTPTEELEHPMAFDDFYYPTGEGTGGTFDRAEYLSILQDMALSFGNAVIYNDDSAFLPAGVDVDEVARPLAERCPGEAGAVLTIPTGFYDDEYNPDGSKPVIMFCDGGSNRLLGCDVAPEGAACDPDIAFDRYCYLNSDDEPDQPNRGWYPGPESQNRPVLIAWAVDVNGNGQRDRGEPVIRNFYEPYQDIGADGLANVDEPGYDPDDNPDPNGDDFDWFDNPSGTEGNWLFEAGEPYDDFGLDGVDGTAQLDAGGYDWGEGNGRFDYNPNLETLLSERDPHHIVQTLSDDDWDHLTLYIDAGIRDLFNFAVGANQLVGMIQGAGENVRIYNNFHALANLDPELDPYRFNEVDYPNVGDHVYLRYGDPESDEEMVCVGDGKHVGPPGQIANRLLTLLGFVEARFPDGEYTQLEVPFPTPLGNYRFFSEALGAQEQYSIILPPGHELTACSDTEDNDDDGLEDGDDPGCEHGMDNSEGPGLGEPFCNDGIDNDRDGLTDAEEDGDCADADDTSEWPADHPMRDTEYPVVYLLHGYGQTPDDLLAAVAPFAAFMGAGFWQKVIVVYPDGFCGDNEILQCNDGVDNDGDELVDGDDPDCADSGGRGEDGTAYRRCEDGIDNDNDGLADDEDGGCVNPTWDDESDCVKGNFYTNHAAWPDGSSPGPPFEDAMLDLVDHIDAVYRTRQPESFPAVR